MPKQVEESTLREFKGGENMKEYALQTPKYSESYIREFVAKAFEVGHIPTVAEFEYCEKDNSVSIQIENTVLMALSFTAALNTAQHNALLEMCDERTRVIFESFEEHEVVLTIFENHYAVNN